MNQHLRPILTAAGVSSGAKTPLPSKRRAKWLRPGLGLCLAIAAAHPAAAAPPLPSIPSGTFTVTSYGAVGDGKTNNTSAIQKAINAAKSAGGGTVVVPKASKAYLSGPLTLSSKINLEIAAGATLQALPYGTYSGTNNLVYASGASNVEISGTGTIDGDGESGWWTSGSGGGPVSSRPDLVKFNSCDTVEVTGVTLSNSFKEHLVFNATSNVTVNAVTIFAPSTSPNTDGIDPAGSHYLIENCSIADGDDNIAIKAGSTPCSDYTVTNCNFGAGHGLSVGGQTNQGLNGLTVTGCSFSGTQYGIRLKANRGNGGLVQNCTYDNLTMTNVQYPIYITSYYNDYNPPNTSASRNPPVPDSAKTFGSTTTPQWKNITINGLTATDSASGSYAGLIWGVPESLVGTVTLNNVNITSHFGMIVNYASSVSFTGTSSIHVSSGAPFSNPMATTSSSVSIKNLYDATLHNAP